MTPVEIDQFLRDHHFMHLATARPGGMPHLVSMWYGLIDGHVAFWSYAKAQKILNLRRNPQLACQIEDGQHPSEVRGIEIEGTARFVEDLAEVAAVGRAVNTQGFGQAPTDEALERMGVRKRVAVIVEPVRIASWDHRKIPGGYLGSAIPTTLA
ncbi:MAG: hypothetical protein QOH68_2375 [Nocardioidaceae bacterium]|jgi:PPOX class probable F420-dependent enzyme|nr:hypothetical protein [Nocardioidaceae bacterium]